MNDLGIWVKNTLWYYAKCLVRSEEAVCLVWIAVLFYCMGWALFAVDWSWWRIGANIVFTLAVVVANPKIFAYLKVLENQRLTSDSEKCYASKTITKGEKS